MLVLGRGKQVALIDNPRNEELLIELAHKAEHGGQDKPASADAEAQEMEVM